MQGVCSRGERFLGIPPVEQPGETGNRHEAAANAFASVDEGSVGSGKEGSCFLEAELYGGCMVSWRIDVEVRVAGLCVRGNMAVEHVGVS